MRAAGRGDRVPLLGRPRRARDGVVPRKRRRGAQRAPCGLERGAGIRRAPSAAERERERRCDQRRGPRGRRRRASATCCGRRPARAAWASRAVAAWAAWAGKDSCGLTEVRPARALRSRALVTIVALLIGLLVGAWRRPVSSCAPALAERRAQGERALELERDLAGDERRRLEAAERSFDTSLAEAVRTRVVGGVPGQRGPIPRRARGAAGDDRRAAPAVAPGRRASACRSSIARASRPTARCGSRSPRVPQRADGQPRERAARRRPCAAVGARRSSGTSSSWPGMVEHCDFVAQASTQGRRGRPPAARPRRAHPGRKAGRRRREGTARRVPRGVRDGCDEEERRHRLRRARPAGARARDRSSRQKGYWRQFAPTPDFVVMFVPDETLLRVAHEHDRRLGRGRVGAGRGARVAEHAHDAAAHGRTPSGSRRRSRESAQAVHELGARAPQAARRRSPAHLAKLGRSLDGAVGSYNEAVGSLRVAGCSSRRGASRSTVSQGSPRSPRADRAPDPVRSELVYERRGGRRSSCRVTRTPPDVGARGTAEAVDSFLDLGVTTNRGALLDRE